MRTTRCLSSMSLALLAAALLIAPAAGAASAGGSTLYACVSKKAGTIRLVSATTKCKRSERRASWNAVGPAGAAGAAGASGSSGASGAPGQPQRALRFNASVPASVTPSPVSLFAVDSISYSLVCETILGGELAYLEAQGAAGQSYAQGGFGRPQLQEALPEDPASAIYVSTLGSEAQAVAFGANEVPNKAKQREQYAIWTVSVEGPTALTLIHAWIDTSPGCKVRGTALTVPF